MCSHGNRGPSRCRLQLFTDVNSSKNIKKLNSNFEFVVYNCWHVNVPVCTTVLIDLFTGRDASSLARSLGLCATILMLRYAPAEFF